MPQETKPPSQCYARRCRLSPIQQPLLAPPSSTTTTTTTLNPPLTTINGGFLIVPGQNNGPAQGPASLSPLSVFSMSSVSVKEEELDGNHLVLSGQLVAEGNIISVKTLIDTEASGFAYIDEDFTRRHKLKTYTLKNPQHPK
jgi:hypothetical protein